MPKAKEESFSGKIKYFDVQKGYTNNGLVNNLVLK